MAEVNRDLDLLVGRHFGWGPETDPEPGMANQYIPRFSTDHGAAWNLVQAMADKGYGMKMYSHHKSQALFVSFYREGKDMFNDDYPPENRARGGVAEMPRVICLAALRGLGIEIPDEITRGR